MTDINKISANPKPIERSLNGFEKPFETVYELKKDEYKVPSFEEFMKTYESDGKVNYADLEHSSIGDSKGYEPCSGCSGNNKNLTFKLEVILKNHRSGWKKSSVYNIDDARKAASEIIRKEG